MLLLLISFFFFWIVISHGLHVENIFFYVIVACVNTQMFFFELFFADDNNVSGVSFFDGHIVDVIIVIDIFFAGDNNIIIIIFRGLWFSQKIFGAQIAIVIIIVEIGEEKIDFVADFVFFEHLIVVFDDFADFIELDLVVFHDFFDVDSDVGDVAEELENRDAFE